MALVNQGKPLTYLFSSTQGAAVSATSMFSLLSLLVRSIEFSRDAAVSSPATDLMEFADTRAGLDPHHAQELREAASAWLRVVR